MDKQEETIALIEVLAELLFRHPDKSLGDILRSYTGSTVPWPAELFLSDTDLMELIEKHDGKDLD